MNNGYTPDEQKWLSEAVERSLRGELTKVDLEHIQALLGAPDELMAWIAKDQKA